MWRAVLGSASAPRGKLAARQLCAIAARHDSSAGGGLCRYSLRQGAGTTRPNVIARGIRTHAQATEPASRVNHAARERGRNAVTARQEGGKKFTKAELAERAKLLVCLRPDGNST